MPSFILGQQSCYFPVAPANYVVKRTAQRGFNVS